jgi:hypothetical protein
MEIDGRRTVVAALDEIVVRFGYLPRVTAGISWVVSNSDSRALAIVIQSLGGWEPIVSVVSPDAEVNEVGGALHFEHFHSREAASVAAERT